jgi:hypothetical protein
VPLLGGKPTIAHCPANDLALMEEPPQLAEFLFLFALDFAR